MAIPWLIGIAAVAVGTAIVKKLSDDDNRGGDDDNGEESRRREQAERERKEKDRKKKFADAHENFAIRGERLGEDIKKSLQGWIAVQFERSPAFLVELGDEGYKIKQAGGSNQNISDLLPSKNHQFDEICKNLKVYSDLYSIRLEKEVKLTDVSNEIESINFEIQQIDQIKLEIIRLKNEISSQS